MHYIIYKTTNLINGKYYIGKHQTNNLNDGYVGSGKLLKRAIKKYGIDNFKTEILLICPTEYHMNLAEKIYVVIDAEVSYNLCRGGKGGFGYINDNKLNLYGKNGSNGCKILIKNHKMFKFKFKHNHFFRDKILANLKIAKIKLKEKYPHGTFYGKRHTEETIKKMKISSKDKQLGNKNSQFGTCWITNGKINKKIKKEDVDLWAEQGYYKGRIMGL